MTPAAEQSCYFWSRWPSIPRSATTIDPFSREHRLVGSNEFPSLKCLCIVVHLHQPHGPILFGRVRWDFICVQCDVCTDMGPPVLSPIRED